MTYHEFNMCRRQWASEWKEKWSALDIDFKTYMLMKGITEKQYEELYNTKPDIPLGETRNEQDQIISYRSESGYWYEYTYDNHGNELTYINALGHWYECFYDIAVDVDDSIKVHKI